MFGYVLANQPELKRKDFSCYRSFYCGLCHTLTKRFGQRGRMLLNYDMAFLYLLLTSLYEPPSTKARMTCISHPFQKQPVTYNQAADYVADMNLLLAYHNLEDKVRDDHKVSAALYCALLRVKKKMVQSRCPRQAKAAAKYIRQLNVYETAGQTDIDRVANLTGEMLRELFCYRNDEWSKQLGDVGFYLGKFIYLLDAYEDIEEDAEKNHYNIWLFYQVREDFELFVEEILTSMMAACTAAFERLPIVEHIDILRNILYSGVWARYQLTAEKRRKKHA